MNTLVPIASYAQIYFNILLIISVIVFFQSLQYDLESSSNLKGKKALGIVIFTFLLFYLGLRPINFRFGDMVIYNIEFQRYVKGAPFNGSKDFIFECIKYFFARYLNASSFFFFCALLYVVPLYSVSKKIFKDYWFYAFFLLIASFSFWAYGTNGIRNGIATSLFLYAITINNKLFKYVFLTSLILIHKSIILPIVIYLFVIRFNYTKLYLKFWLLAVPLSLALGSFWERFFLGFGFGDEKLDGYLGGIDQSSEGVTLIVGFRWDFLIYSFLGISACWYYIVKKKYEDKMYFVIANTYIIANGFWILVIRASYSNRFAYLSWFLLAIVLIYPLLKSKLFNNQHKIIGYITIVYFAFTYLLNVILAKL